METLRPFALAKEEALFINLQTDRGGYLELQAVSGGPIFLFRGRKTAAEAKVASEGANCEFALAAAVGQSAKIKLEPGPGGFTVYTNVASIGFVRACESNVQRAE